MHKHPPTWALRSVHLIESFFSIKGESKGESGMNGENSINVSTLPCVRQMAAEKLPYNPGSPV